MACLIFLPDKLSDNILSGTLPGDAIKAMVIACHGFRGGKENGGRIGSLGGKLTAHGFGLLAFDFRGTGESSGSFTDMTVSAQAADLQQVISWVEYTYKVPPIVLGRSLGGSTALTAASNDERLAAMVLWSTPIKVRETFAAILGPLADEMAAGKTITIQDDYSTYQLGSGFWMDLDNHNFERCLQQSGANPLLVIHGEADEIVSLNNAMIVKKAVPSAQLITVPGADHKFISGWELRENLTVAWLNYLFTRR